MISLHVSALKNIAMHISHRNINTEREIDFRKWFMGL